MKTLIVTFVCEAAFCLGMFIPQAYAQAAVETAAPTHALMTQQEQEIRMRAKKRLYPGGKDEESLKVQAQLPTVTRRMAPTTEAPSDEPEVTDTSAD